MKFQIICFLSFLFIVTNANLQAQDACEVSHLNLTNLANGTQEAKTITATAVLESGVSSTLIAGNSITLNPGFFAKAGSSFTAKIYNCTDPVYADACTPPDASIWDTPWISCQTNSNPNETRGNSHWIRYDFGSAQKLAKMHVWNVNKSGETNKGFKAVAIDYSLNGITWNNLGTFQFAQGTEEAVYQGFEAANFEGTNARYVLLTALSNWGGNCSGISDVRFDMAPPLLQNVESVFANRPAAIANQASLKEETIRLYPNPASASTTILLESTQAQLETISIVDITGSVVQTYPIDLQAGSNDRTVSLVGIPSGSYFVKVGTLPVQKLIVVQE